MATNDITGDELRSKAVTDSYRENFDRIFGITPAETKDEDKEVDKEQEASKKD